MGFAVAGASVLAMVTAAFLGRLAQGSWLAPTPVMAVLWAFIAGLPLVVAPDYPFRAGGYVFLGGVIVTAVLVGTVASHFTASTSAHARRVRIPRLPTWRWRSPERLYTLSLLPSFAAPIALFVAAVDAFGFTSLTTLAASVTRARYESGYGDPIVVRALIATVYASAALGGWSAGRGRIATWRSLLWIVPMLGVVAVNTGRSGLVLATVLWVAYWVAARRVRSRQPLPDVRHLLRTAAGAFVVLLAIFVVTQFARTGQFDPSLAGGILDRARVYFAGAAPTFSVWFAEGASPGPAWGRATFASLADAIGVGDRTLGKYTDPVTLSPGQTGNIYTVFRPLIEDFGHVGAWIAWSVLTAVASVAWTSHRHAGAWSMATLSLYYAFLLFGPVTTIFQWSSSTAVLLLAPLLVRDPRATQRSHRPST